MKGLSMMGIVFLAAVVLGTFGCAGLEPIQLDVDEDCYELAGQVRCALLTADELDAVGEVTDESLAVESFEYVWSDRSEFEGEMAEDASELDERLEYAWLERAEHEREMAGDSLEALPIERAEAPDLRNSRAAFPEEAADDDDKMICPRRIRYIDDVDQCLVDIAIVKETEGPGVECVYEPCSNLFHVDHDIDSTDLLEHD